MNEVYSTLWCPLQNHFCPSLKLQKKHRDGAKVIKNTMPRKPLTNGCSIILTSRKPPNTLSENSMPNSIHLLSKPLLSNN